jgi:hypothetical protein
MEAAQKALFLALSPPQREVLARLLVSEREGAVRDVLAYLEWATVTDALDMIAAGEHFSNWIEHTVGKGHLTKDRQPNHRDGSRSSGLGASSPPFSPNAIWAA